MQQWQVLLRVGLLLPVDQYTPMGPEPYTYPSRPGSGTLDVSLIRNMEGLTAYLGEIDILCDLVLNTLNDTSIILDSISLLESKSLESDTNKEVSSEHIRLDCKRVPLSIWKTYLVIVPLLE